MRIRKLNLWGWIWFTAGVLYFFVPLIATFEFSLRAKKGTLSLLAYQQVLEDPQFWHTFGFSVSMGIVTILIGAQIKGDVLHNVGLGYALALGMVVVMAFSMAGYYVLRRRSERWMRK
jgi:hypothetical protein